MQHIAAVIQRHGRNKVRYKEAVTTAHTFSVVSVSWSCCLEYGTRPQDIEVKMTCCQ